MKTTGCYHTRVQVVLGLAYNFVQTRDLITLPIGQASLIQFLNGPRGRKHDLNEQEGVMSIAEHEAHVRNKIAWVSAVFAMTIRTSAGGRYSETS
jgi:hypothetical protein